MPVYASEMKGRVEVEGVDRSTKDITGFGTLFDRTAAQLNKSGSLMGRALETTGRAVTTLAKAGALAAGGGIIALATGFGAAAVSGLRFNSNMENVTAQLNAFTKDGTKSAEILDMIRDRAARTPFAFGEMASAAAGLIPASRQANESLESIIETAEILAASNPAEGLEGAAFAIREAVSGDFASAIERFNLPRQMINDLKEEGVPNLEIIRRAMQAMGYDIDLVNNLAETATGRWSTFKDTLVGLAATATSSLFEGLSSGLGTVNQWLTENNASLETFAAWVGERLGAALQTGIGFITETVIPTISRMASLWRDAGQGASGLAEQVTIFAGRLAGLSAEQIVPFLETIQGLRERFGLGRDAVLTFISALQGDWKWAENIHPLHEAVGLLGTEIREKVLGASKDLTAFWNDTLKPALTTVAGIIDTEVRRAYDDLVTSWKTDAIPTMRTIRQILDEQLTPAYVSHSDKVRDTTGGVQTAWDVYLERVRHNGGEIRKEIQMVIDLFATHETEFVSRSDHIRSNLDTNEQSWAEWWRGVNQNLIDADLAVDRWGNATLKWLDDTANGMVAFSTAFGKAIQGFVAEVRALPSTVAGAAAELGVSIVTGVAAGIRSVPGVIGGALGKMVGDAIASARRLLDARSPSRVTAREIGEPMAEGIASGILRRNDFVEDAVLTVLDDAFVIARRAIGVTAGTSQRARLDIGEPIVRGIADGIIQRNDFVQDAVRTTADRVFGQGSAAVAHWTREAQRFGQDTADSFTGAFTESMTVGEGSFGSGAEAVGTMIANAFVTSGLFAVVGEDIAGGLTRVLRGFEPGSGGGESGGGGDFGRGKNPFNPGGGRDMFGTPARATAPSAVTYGPTTVNVYPSPGMDERALAELAVQAVDRATRERRFR